MNKKFIIAAVFAVTFFATTPIAHAATSLYYTFNSDGILHESYPMEASSSKYFWLNSGGQMPIKAGLGGTNQGALPATNKWRLLYNQNNPLDTGNGYYPQNLFRWVTRSTWTNISQELPFKIAKLNKTNTPNRDGYSGVLLFARYASDGQTTYYAGVRQDGAVVIKKKYKGTYYTMSQVNGIFSNGSPYNRDSNPEPYPGKQMDGHQVRRRQQGRRHSNSRPLPRQELRYQDRPYLDQGRKRSRCSEQVRFYPGPHDQLCRYPHRLHGRPLRQLPLDGKIVFR
jgi:hypothetical protein